jgi:hypothetical protein
MKDRTKEIYALLDDMQKTLALFTPGELARYLTGLLALSLIGEMAKDDSERVAVFGTFLKFSKEIMRELDGSKEARGV